MASNKSLNGTLNESKNSVGGGGGRGHPALQTLVPMSRVKTIMKSSPEITTINNDTLFVVCKATELFMRTLAIESFKTSGSKDSDLDYSKIATLVSNDEKYEFLAGE